MKLKLSYKTIVKQQACAGGIARHTHGRWFRVVLLNRPIAIGDILADSRYLIGDRFWVCSLVADTAAQIGVLDRVANEIIQEASRYTGRREEILYMRTFDLPSIRDGYMREYHKKYAIRNWLMHHHDPQYAASVVERHFQGVL